jgi:C-terminal processing protease CtpA/Prc
LILIRKFFIFYKNIFSCGALHCGDQINAIDQKSFEGMSLTEANAILRSCTGDFCRIEVTPSNTLASSNIMMEQSNDIRIHSPTNRGLFNENNRQTFYRTPSMNPMQGNNGSWTMRNSYQNIAKKSVNKTRHNSISKINDFFF